jgi:hypothetical protein
MSRLDQMKGFIADLARPFAIISTAFASSWAIVVIAYRVETGEGGAIFIAAVLTGLAGLYGFKALENTRVAGHQADVEKARVNATPPPGTAQVTAAPDVDITVREAADPGELPPEQQVRL